MNYLVTNFAYGIGPYLRTTELAIAFNDALEKAGHPRLGCVIPLVYGEKQKRIMREEFGEHDRTHPRELLLDGELGRLLRGVFYGNNTYAEALRTWVETEAAVSRDVMAYLAGDLATQTLEGERLTARGRDIVLELNRSPRVHFGITPSYFTTFGYIEDILRGAREAGYTRVAVDPKLLERGIAIARRIEERQSMHAVAYPGTFSGDVAYQEKYPTEFLTPPIRDATMEEQTEDIEPGIFVTVTGIPGLERLYAEAGKLGLKLYSNDLASVPGSARRFSPNHGLNRNIVLHFARSGWGSVWLSLFCGVPILVPEYDPRDDPEIYFNNAMVEALGLGLVYRGEPLADILARGEKVRENYATMRERIMARWGTLDGNRVCVAAFLKHFLSR